MSMAFEEGNMWILLPLIERMSRATSSQSYRLVDFMILANSAIEICGTQGTHAVAAVK